MRILLVQTGFLGDLILSTPVMTNIKKQYPGCSLTVLTTPLGGTLITDHKDVDDVLTFDKRKKQKGIFGLLNMLAIIKAENFDLVFSLHKSYRTALLLYLSGIKKRYGFKEASASFLYSKTARRKDLEHEVLRNLAIFRCIGLEPAELEQAMSLGFSKEVNDKVDELLSGIDKPLLGIAPGSVWATKRWTTDGFAAVAKEFASKGYQIVLIGGPDDLKTAEDIQKLSAVECTNLVAKTSLIESAAVVSRLSALVSNDSAPLHMASACETPVAAVFCATVPEFGFGPWGTEAEILGVPGLECRPCGRHGGNTCPTGTHDCQLKLKSKAVIEATKRVLERVGSNV